MPFGNRPAPRGTDRKCFYPRPSMKKPSCMARKQDTGFHSAAGLIRYFDQEDEKALKVPPLVVVALCIVVSAIVLYVGYLWPT